MRDEAVAAREQVSAARKEALAARHEVAAARVEASATREEVSAVREEAADALEEAVDALEDAVEPDAESPGDGEGADLSGLEKAKLIALNMALNGAARAETERYLMENLRIADPSALLREVYRASPVEGDS